MGDLQQLNNEAKFNVNDIVYYLPSLALKILGEELDLKVLEIKKVEAKVPIAFKKNAYYYDLISGKGQFRRDVEESQLIAPKERIFYKNLPTKELVEDTELCPSGTFFLLNGEYWVNDEYGISISQPRMNKLVTKDLFKNYTK